jgi:hypothetical protein
MVILILAMMLIGSGAASVGSLPLALGLFGVFAAAHLVSLLAFLLSGSVRTRRVLRAQAWTIGEPARRPPGAPRDYVVTPRSSGAAV